MSFPACSHCAQMHKVEPCFECNKPLCNECLNVHYNDWKIRKIEKSDAAISSLVHCKEKLDSLNPLFEKNKNELLLATEKIKKSYNTILQRLKDEKEALDRDLDRLISDNNKITAFHQSINETLQNFNVLRDPNEKYDRASASNLMRKVDRNIEESAKIEKDFDAFKNSSLKTIKGFEEVPVLGQDRLIGRLDITEQNLSTYQPPRPRSDGPVPMMAMHARASLVNFVDTDYNNLSRWKARLDPSNPRSTHFDFKDLMPSMCVHKNRLYVIKKETIHVFETVTQQPFREVASYKLALPGMAAVAVNNTFLVVSYTDLAVKIKHLTSDASRPAGVLVFRRNGNDLTYPAEKSLRSAQGDFVKPKGMAMNEKHLFVCDYKLGSIFKLDMESFSLVHVITVPGSGPYKISVNHNYAVVTDMLKNAIHLYDINSMVHMKERKIKEYVSDGKGPYDVFITQDNIIFVKCDWTENIMILDAKLDTHVASFNIKNSKILSFAMIEFQPNPMFIFSLTDDKSHKLVLYGLSDLS